MPGFQEWVPYIADGEPVEASVANRTAIVLDGNIRYLRDLLQATRLHSYLAQREVPIDPIVEVGMPVYWNSQRGRFERAMLLATNNAETGELELADVAQVWGIVFRKLAAHTADILLYGFAKVDISPALLAPLEPGLYYLAPSPGRLIRRPASLSLPVLWADGQGGVFVQPRPWEALLGHRHYQFELICLPAGTHQPPSPGSNHQITDPNPSQPGWLPANHPSFQGFAPAGAKFGYNLALAPFRYLWPPQPLHQAYLEWHRGGLSLGGFAVPKGADGLAIIDDHGIWWMSNCYGEVPWPADLDTENPPSEAPAPECPRPDMAMILYFSRWQSSTGDGAVLSLRPSANSRIRVRRVGTAQDATTGHLEISDDMQLLLDPQLNTMGHIVLKGIQDNRITRGPVVEALRSGSSRVQLSSDLGAPPDGNYRGRVTISVRTDLASGQLPIEIVRLEGVTEEFFAQVLGLGFPAGRQTSFRARFSVPAHAEVGAGAQVRVIFLLLGRVAGTLPPLQMSYRKIQRPLSGPLPLPLNDQSLALNSEAVVAANEYVEVRSSPFPIADGDVVLFSLRRNLDSYAGEVHVIHMAAQLE